MKKPAKTPGAGVYRTCIRCGGFAARGEMKQVQDGKRVAYRHRGDCLRLRRQAREGKVDRHAAVMGRREPPK